ncbi:hypothetical protein SAMN07250955_107209 [Arboricoccus pini]|uniref:Uncharacterized protein n=1 Tax=Arboricoccus pini TaxID=1963835 RepID=A0A212RDY4_9PROT|nr:hypothetical protein [Arboricoccus pini]SNB70467.1 hypothetical protein SAMN07250955_107209 [Arboricoccus pini]
MTTTQADCIKAIKLGLAGEWDGAHAIVQDAPSAEAAWVHAWLHRVEGDLANAGYWYRRAGQPMPAGDVASEGRAIAASLGAILDDDT